MKVSIRIDAGRAGGKSHLAEALKKFLTEEYPNAVPITVEIRQFNPGTGRFTDPVDWWTIDPKPLEVILPKGCHYKEFPGGEVQVLRGKEVLREARNKPEMIHWLIREPL